MNPDLEKNLVAQVSADCLMEYTRNIAQWVRITSLPGELESLQYVRATLDSFGYRTQLLEYSGFISYPLAASVAVEGEEGSPLRALAHCFTASTPEEGLCAPLADGAEDCAGKIVLLDGLPNVNKIMSAKAAGAAAVICVQDDYLHNMPVNPIWGSPTTQTERYLPGLPVVSVTRASGKLLRERMTSQGEVGVVLRSQVEMGWKQKLPVLVADLPAPAGDKFVLLSCHIDSWDYGAMDNGSANATAIECARVLAQYRDHFKRGLRVAFWSGHSQGKFCGSSWYADTHYEELQENCVAHVNIDSTGGKGAVVVEEAPVMPHTRALAASVIRDQLGVEFLGNRIGHFADQSFFGVGLSSVFGTFSEQDAQGAGDSLSFSHGKTIRAKGLGWWWHTEHDTVDKVDPALLLRDTRVYAAVLWRLMTDEVLPFCFSDAVEDLEKELARLKSELGGRFDLSAMEQRLRLVKGKVQAFQDRAAMRGGQMELDGIYQALARYFVQLQFHSGNPYDYDLGTSMPAIPCLAPLDRLAAAQPGTDAYYMAELSARRGMNRAMGYLRQILGLLDAFLGREGL